MNRERKTEARSGNATLNEPVSTTRLDMEVKTKHLEFIQATINRMAQNSFLLKGWAITLVGALLALTFKEIDKRYLLISVAVLVLFWALDAYYLSRERGFIRLYDDVRTSAGATTDFAMDVTEFIGNRSWPLCTFSRTLLVFYGGLLSLHLLIGRLL
jgi:hypothetical protein